jgi:hypothetical protein
VQPQRKERLDNLENEDRDNNSISELLRTPRQPNPWPNEALGRFSARGTPKKHQDPLDKAGSFREVAPNAVQLNTAQNEHQAGPWQPRVATRPGAHTADAFPVLSSVLPPRRAPIYPIAIWRQKRTNRGRISENNSGAG